MMWDYLCIGMAFIARLPLLCSMEPYYHDMGDNISSCPRHLITILKPCVRLTVPFAQHMLTA